MVSSELFHGGTNFGRSAGGPFITTSYDYDAPIDEYAFLSNYDTNNAAKVTFNNKHYNRSIIILPDCNTVVYNTANVWLVTEFGWPIYERPVQDLAFGVARFIQKGGSFFNYYMGTNFGRSAGGPFITTSYDYDAPIDEYGLIREPKYSHLKNLHKVIKQCEPALLSAEPVITSLGSLQQAHVFSPKSGPCAAFLSNYDMNNAAKVTFNNKHYTLPPWSISILPDCNTVVYNTANVEVQSTKMEMKPSDSNMFSWEMYTEDLTVSDESSTFTATGLLEQINITRDTSDYLWYTTSVDIGSSESFLRGGEPPKLLVQSMGHALHVFVNGEHSVLVQENIGDLHTKKRSTYALEATKLHYLVWPWDCRAWEGIMKHGRLES